MHFNNRLYPAFRAAGIHLLGSVFVAAWAALLVFLVWYPYPYRELAGGRELFFLIVVVDVVCGPLLTMVLFNPAKPRVELVRDLGLVVLVQLVALLYGMWSVWQARPLFLVQEVDRFKVIAAPDLGGASLAELPKQLKPALFSGPITVAIREPKDDQERSKVTMESAVGGADYAERPEFYIAYEGAAASKSLSRAKPLVSFLQKHPNQELDARKLAKEKSVDVNTWFYLPVIARQDWVAVLNKQGHIEGFLKGDGF
jgi:hypothetical protein